jgi:hypothetical protein
MDEEEKQGKYAPTYEERRRTATTRSKHRKKATTRLEPFLPLLTSNSHF